MLKAIIFDLDDTLYPEREFVLSGFRAVALWVEQNMGIDSTDCYQELVHLFENNAHGRTFDLFLENHGLLSASAIQKMVQIYRTHYPEIVCFPEIPDVLIQLKKRFKIGLLSDGYLDVQKRKIEALGLRHYFDAVVFSDQWGRKAWKPNPRPFKTILEILAITARQAVYIADNPIKDFLGARRAGMASIRIRLEGGIYNDIEPISDDYRPDVEIMNFQQLGEKLSPISS